MDLALYSLQRRADLIKLKQGGSVSIKNRTIEVRQEKSEHYDRPVFIQITMGAKLFDAAQRSAFAGIPSPYLIKCRQRLTTKARQSKDDAFCVTKDYLTRAYSKVRDEVGVYNHLPKEQRPGLHSERALGIYLYDKAGYPEEYIMALAGHATKQMKDRYVSGHEKPKPVLVEAGLSLGDISALNNINWETDLSPSLAKLISEKE